MIRYLPLLLLVAASPAQAQAPDAQVETTVEGNTFLVGQRVPIYVKLLTTTTFAGAPVFDLPSLPGALLMEVQDRPMLGSETDQGTSYISQTHELALFPQQAGMLTLPAFTVRFASTGTSGGTPEDHRLQTQPVTVTAALPEGAKGAGPFIVGQDVKLTEEWQPPVDDLKPGDAVTRTVRLQAVDVPAMMLPPLTKAAVSGWKAYPRPPELVDQQERGAFTGRRTERVTYVAETSGTVTLPPLEVRWWDASTGDTEVAELPGRTITIGAGTAPATTTAPVRVNQPQSSTWPVLVVAGILLVAGVAVVIGRRRPPAPEGSEADAFAKLEDALASGDARRSEAALFVWLDRLPELLKPATIGALATYTGNRALTHEADQLLQAAQSHQSWNGEALRHHLRGARQWFRRSSQRADELALGPLNPSR